MLQGTSQAAFPRKRLVKSCTRRLRGNVADQDAVAIVSRLPGWFGAAVS